jgi:hypothetical protein
MTTRAAWAMSASRCTTPPGQQARGSATRSFERVSHTTSSQNSPNTCNSSNKSTSDCSSSPEARSTTTTDPVRWVVTRDDLSPPAGEEP